MTFQKKIMNNIAKSFMLLGKKFHNVKMYKRLMYINCDVHFIDTYKLTETHRIHYIIPKSVSDYLLLF